MDELQIPTRKNGLEFADVAIWLSFLGIAFAVGAAVYVWLSRGQFAWVMVGASIWALDITLRYHWSRRRNPK